MRKLLDMADSIERVPQFFGRLGAWFLIPLFAIIVFDVLTRKFQFIQIWIQQTALYDFISPTRLQEMQWHLHTALFLTAIGFAYTMNAHIRVDVIREKLADRKQAWIEMFGLIFLLFPYLIVISILAAEFIWLAYESNEASGAMTGLTHRWIIKSFLLFGLVLTFLAGISTLFRHIVYLFGPEHLRDDVKMNMLSSADAEHLPKVQDDWIEEETELVHHVEDEDISETPPRA